MDPGQLGPGQIGPAQMKAGSNQKLAPLECEVEPLECKVEPLEEVNLDQMDTWGKWAPEHMGTGANG